MNVKNLHNRVTPLTVEHVDALLREHGWGWTFRYLQGLIENDPQTLNDREFQAWTAKHVEAINAYANGSPLEDI